MLIIVTFIIKKKARPSTQRNKIAPGANVNESFQGEFELHTMPVKM